MSNCTYVTIEEFLPAGNQTSLPPMQIGNADIGFLSHTIARTSELNASSDNRRVEAIFFKGSPSEIRLLATLSDRPTKNRDAVLRGMFKPGVLDTETLGNVSLFLRDSSTVEMSDAERTSRNGSLFVDSGKFAYVGSSPVQFERVMLVSMLSTAYRLMLERRVISLSETSRDKLELQNVIDLYRDMIEFNAGFYQRLPIRLERHEISKVWDEFSRRYRLDVLREEIDGQLTALAQWLHQEQEKAAKTARDNAVAKADTDRQEQQDAEDARERRFNRRVANMTIAFAAFSLFVAVIATPISTLEEKIDWVAGTVDATSRTVAGIYQGIVIEAKAHWKAMR